ncbi:hypothetical protein [Micromonospora tulbaghiae]|uniref:hypothetical protein n=1 Tax=Micromonospora tulbaghiae TaxID=479978 RepID=UPI000EA3338A|nr:hypothetical protein [Micromonospora tulbaghiae]
MYPALVEPLGRRTGAAGRPALAAVPTGQEIPAAVRAGAVGMPAPLVRPRGAPSAGTGGTRRVRPARGRRPVQVRAAWPGRPG